MTLDTLGVFILRDQINEFKALFELHMHPPLILTPVDDNRHHWNKKSARRYISTFRYAYNNNATKIFQYLLGAVNEGKLIATFNCRISILEAPYILKKEKEYNLKTQIRKVKAADKYCKVEFDSKFSRNGSQILYVDNSKDIDFEQLPKKIPIKYALHKDFVDHVTVGYPMLSPNITHEENL